VVDYHAVARANHHVVARAAVPRAEDHHVVDHHAVARAADHSLARVWLPKKKPRWEEGKSKEGKEASFFSRSSPPTKTVTPRSSSSAKQVRPAPRLNLPDSSDESDGGLIKAFRERHEAMTKARSEEERAHQIAEEEAKMNLQEVEEKAPEDYGRNNAGEEVNDVSKKCKEAGGAQDSINDEDKDGDDDYDLSFSASFDYNNDDDNSADPSVTEKNNEGTMKLNSASRLESSTLSILSFNSQHEYIHITN